MQINVVIEVQYCFKKSSNNVLMYSGGFQKVLERSAKCKKM